MRAKISSLFIAVAIILSLILIGLWIWKRPKASPTDRTYTIGYQEISLYQHVFTAKEKGYFEEEGLKVKLEPFASANRMMEGLLSGSLDATGLTNLQVAVTIEAKDPGHFKLTHFLVWGDHSYPDYILACNGVPGLKLDNLHGHTLGLHPGSAVRGFATTILRDAGVDPKKVNMVEIEPSLMAGAVSAKRVDALYCMDPVATELLQKKLCSPILANPMRAIFPPPTPISAMAISSRMLSQDPKATRAMMKAVDRAIRYMRQPGVEKEIASYIAKYTPVSRDEALEMNRSEYWTSDEVNAARVQDLANRFLAIGIVPKNVNVQGILYRLEAK